VPTYLDTEVPTIDTQVVRYGKLGMFDTTAAWSATNSGCHWQCTFQVADHIAKARL